ncbi:MAG: winged helix-turn-helix domain-containing protein [Calditrichaeota bacterium]|nr:winged helix-turn-helix domain-containing protein [Calditrichota bacterium]
MTTIQIDSSYQLNMDTCQLIDLKEQRGRKIEPMIAEFIAYLVSNKERLITRDELIDRFWGEKVNSDESLTQAIAKVRRLFADNGKEKKLILTVPKRGFKWQGLAVEKQTIKKGFSPVFAVALSTIVYILFRIYLHPH